MKIIETVKKYWLRFKWRIVGIASLVVISGLLILLSPKGQEQKIKAAIIAYHHSKGEKVKVSALSFSPVSASYPDSMRSVFYLAKFDSLSVRALQATRLDLPEKPEIMHMRSVLEDSVLQARERMKKTGPVLIKCSYTAEITTATAHFTTQKNLILNQGLTPVY